MISSVVFSPRCGWGLRLWVDGLSGCLGEVVAVLEGSGVESAAECSVHGFDRAEAAGGCDLFDGQLGAFDQSAGRFEAECFDVLGGSDAYFGGEPSAEVSFGQVGPMGQFGDAEVLGEVFGKPRQQVL